ncbi:MAG: hypothetical protein WBO17_00295, partial [Sphingorhabdus sp.]
MTQARQLKTVGRAAFIAIILSGSSLSFAQDGSPTILEQPVPEIERPVAVPEPVVQLAEPPFVPPAVVPTLPERTVPVAKATADPKAGQGVSRATARDKPPAAPAERTAQKSTGGAVVSPSTTTMPENVNTDTIPGPEGATTLNRVITENRVAAPESQVSTAQANAIVPEDWTLIGGLAAALGALGLGAILARRRRRPGQLSTDARAQAPETRSQFGGATGATVVPPAFPPVLADTLPVSGQRPFASR